MKKTSRETRQKKMIGEELDKFNSFFTAVELHEMVKMKNPAIGIATIYRFLDRKKKMGQLHSYICDRRSIFSSNLSNHCHFTCQMCGRTMHINIDKLDFLRKKIKGSVCHFQIDVSGICEKCMNN
ncbi:transcriptional repressor [Candidatus Woesearchaeota archaeon]|nr:transcriptional repressor [Candidatus Woesearchaeota archaeon]